MSSVTFYQCEKCKKRVEDRYETLDWILTTGRVSISKGPRGEAKPGYADVKDRDFCSLKCYMEWLKEL